MDKAIQIVQNYEYCRLSSMAPSNHNVDVVSRRPGKGARLKAPPRTNNANMGSRPLQANNSTAVLLNCGTSHEKKKCPAYGKLCHKCHKKNHFQKCCRSTTFVHEINNDNASASATNVYTGQCENSFDQEYFIDTVSALSSVSLSPDLAFSQLLIGPNQNHLQFAIDTFSAVNALPCPWLVDLGLIKLPYSVETSPRRASSDLDKQSVMNEYAELFAGIDFLPEECKLYIQENAVPVINPPRRNPEALKTKLKEELTYRTNDI